MNIGVARATPNELTKLVQFPPREEIIAPISASLSTSELRAWLPSSLQCNPSFSQVTVQDSYTAPSTQCEAIVRVDAVVILVTLVAVAVLVAVVAVVVVVAVTVTRVVLVLVTVAVDVLVVSELLVEVVVTVEVVV
jgi:hypothetical protein